MQIQSDSKPQHQIVKHLKNGQQIPPAILDQLFPFQNQQLSVYAGLFNLLYQESMPAIKQNNNPAQDLSFPQGNTLKLRGQILRIYGRFLSDVIYEPAYSLITFDHQMFTGFCSERGIMNLLHHSKGIYPEIDLSRKVLLQFLPFCNDVQEEKGKLVGNCNWKLAKKILNIYCDQNLKDGLKTNAQNLGISTEEIGAMNIGIELSFLILAQKQKRLQDYVQKVSEYVRSQLGQDEARVLVNRLNFWFLNYSKFIEQGINYYEDKQGNDIPVLYDLDSTSFESNIISLIIKVNQSKFESVERPAYLLSLKSHFLELVSQIESSSNRQMNRHTKFLFLAYLQSIIKNVGVQIDQAGSPKQVFTSLLSESQEEQPFYHIFYSDDEVLDFYEKGKIREYPSEFQYAPQVTQKILKAYIKNNPQQFIHNLSRINSLPLAEQLRLFVQNTLIGDLDRVDLNQQRSKTPGQTILVELDTNKQKFKELIVDGAGKKTHLQRLTEFINEWKLVYESYRKMDMKMFGLILEEYGKAIAMKDAHLEQRDGQNGGRKQDCLHAEQLKSPYDRPDTAYFLILRFATILNEERTRYCTLKLEQNSSNGLSLSTLQNRIKQLFQVFKVQNFKKMLIFAAVPHQNHVEMADSKQKFEDLVWKVYAETALTFDSLLQDRASKQEQKQLGENESQSDQSSV